jgi:DNA-binding HxlR family transcriptional regulator
MVLGVVMTAVQAERMGAMCDSSRIHVNELLVLLSKSKMLHILYALNCDPKPMRFSEIKREVDSSSTTVTRRLGELEAHGLVNRTVYPTVPTTVEYALTPDAIALAPSLESLFEWVLNRAEKVA